MEVAQQLFSYKYIFPLPSLVCQLLHFGCFVNLGLLRRHIHLGIRARGCGSSRCHLSSSRSHDGVCRNSLGLLLLLRLLGLRGLLALCTEMIQVKGAPKKEKSYLMPGPNWSETVHERDVFPEVGIEPKSRRHGKVRNAEQNNTEYGHGEEETKKTQHAPTQVVHSLSKDQRPQRIQDNGEDDDKGEGSIQLALDLASLPEPHVVHVVSGLLLLLYPDIPLALDTLGLLAVGAGLGLELGDSKRKHAEGQQLKGVL